MRRQMYERLALALVFGMLAVSSAEAATSDVKGAPVIVMNTPSVGGPIPVSGNIGVTGPVTVQGNVTVSGTTDVKVVNAAPINVKNAEPARAVIPISFYDASSSVAYANITLPHQAVLETIAVDACGIKADTLSISFPVNPEAISNVQVEPSQPGVASKSSMASFPYPIIQFGGDSGLPPSYGLPPTRVDLPVGNYFTFAIANSGGKGVSCVGTAIVRYIE